MGPPPFDGRGANSKLRKRFCDRNSDELAPISGRPWRPKETEEGLPPKFTIGIVERRRRDLWLAEETEWESRIGTAITRQGASLYDIYRTTCLFPKKLVILISLLTMIVQLLALLTALEPCF